MTDRLLSLRGLGKNYGEDAPALTGLDLDLSAGECVALIGHNGSGKTTALRLAAGYLEPTAGKASVRGADVHEKRGAAIARSALSFVADDPVLYDDLTVAEHLELVGLAHGVAGDGLDARIEGLLETFGLAERRGSLPGHLSRGLRQKVQLACGFVRPFSVLLLDEPVVGLDPRSQEALRALLIETKRGGAGLLLSTHQLPFARGLADRAVVLDGGKVAAEGPYEAVVGGEEALWLGLG